MLAINMDDVINVLNSCKPYLIALGVVLALAIVVTVACMKLKKPEGASMLWNMCLFRSLKKRLNISE